MKQLNTLLNLTNSELSRSDAKFRNIGTVNSILIGTFVAVLLFAMRKGNLDFYHKWITISIASFFLLLQVMSIIICIYGVWPRKRYKHSPYDIKFISKRKYIDSIKIESFSDKRLRQMIRINATLAVHKRELFRKALIVTIFPISLILLYIVMKQEAPSKKGYLKNEAKYQEMLEKENNEKDK